MCAAPLPSLVPSSHPGCHLRWPDLALPTRAAARRRRARIPRADRHPGGRDPAACWTAGTSPASRRPAPARPPRSACPLLAAIDPAAAGGAGARAHPHPRAGRPGRRGHHLASPGTCRRRHRGADLRRRQLPAAASRAPRRRAGRRRHPRPDHRPPRARHARAGRAASSWCWTRPTRCCGWASPRTSTASCPTRPAERQTALFSATMPPAIRSIAQQHLTDPVDIAVSTGTPRRSTPSGRPTPWCRSGTRSTPWRASCRSPRATRRSCSSAPRTRATRSAPTSSPAASRPPRSTATCRRRSASGSSAGCATADSTCWSPPTSRPAGSTSTGSTWSSTSTRRASPSRTCTASAAPAGPAAAGEALTFFTPKEIGRLRAIERATRNTLERSLPPTAADVADRAAGRQLLAAVAPGRAADPSTATAVPSRRSWPRTT